MSGLRDIPLQRSTSAPSTGSSKGLSVVQTKSKGLSGAIPAKAAEKKRSPLEDVEALAVFMKYDADAKAASVDTLLNALKSVSGEQFEMTLTDLCVIVGKLGLASTEGSRVLEFIASEINNSASPKDGGSIGLSLCKEFLSKLKVQINF